MGVCVLCEFASDLGIFLGNVALTVYYQEASSNDTLNAIFGWFDVNGNAFYFLNDSASLSPGNITSSLNCALNMQLQRGQRLLVAVNIDTGLYYGDPDHDSRIEYVGHVTEDTMPPETTNDYDGLWHNADFAVNLNATDDYSGVNETSYRIDGGPIENVSANGQPIITLESDNNTLEYWSVDNVGREEVHHFLTGIKLDKTPPVGSISFTNNQTYTNSLVVSLNITATDLLSGVHWIRLSNDNTWDTEPWESMSGSKQWTLRGGDGEKTVYLQIEDNAGLLSETYSAKIILDTNPPFLSEPILSPVNFVQNNEPVKVAVNATDSLSGIKSVNLVCFTNGSSVGIDSLMFLNQTSGVYELNIPGQEAGTLVGFQITAFDQAGNSITDNNAGQYFTYSVVSEFPMSVTLFALVILSLSAFLSQHIVRRSKEKNKRKW